MKKALLLIWICISFVSQISAQCYCEDCPEDIIFGAPSSASLNVSGSSNNTLGQNGQSLINVGVSFAHSATQELSLRIVAPNGSFVDLTIGEGLDAGPTAYFDINFVPCSGSPIPDCTNNSTWTSTDNWEGGPYYGSYFPESGCLEGLTGDLNGQWVMELEDVFGAFDGELFCFDLTFADDSGISCNTGGCGDTPCLAQAGTGITPDLLTAPQGDPSLLIDFVVSYGPCEVVPPSPEYIVIYVIYEPFPGPILEIQQGTVDLTGYSEGQYFVQAFSILASDLFQIEALDFSTSNIFDINNLINNGTICGDGNFDASLITIDDCSTNFTGSLEVDNITAEVGDPSLDPSWNITWSPATPDFSIYGLFYVVYDQVTGVIIDYILTDDFTWAAAGDYNVAVLVYNLNDVSNLPPVNGTSVYQDIVNAIAADDICAIIFGNNQLFISEPCTIDVNGSLEQEDIFAPQNDPLLDPDWDITFTGSPPDPALYGFYYVVVNSDTDVLVEYYTTDDFTLLPAGNYYVVILYYLLDDLPSLPATNGVNTFASLDNLINNDLLCAEHFGFNLLVISPLCTADAGVFNPTFIQECLGSNNLQNTIAPDYSSGSEPGPDYTYVYLVAQNNFVFEISADADFSDLDAGIYQICGFSYLTTDESAIPLADGSTTPSAYDQLIIDGIICGDITDVCLTLQIFELPDPMIIGPNEVCIGALYTYEIENYTGDINDYDILITMGGFNDLIVDPTTGEFFINWSAGPGMICLTQNDGDCEGETCTAIDVEAGVDVTITGPEEICLGDEVTYTITPLLGAGETYLLTLMGGSIVTQADPLITILWDGVAPYSISAELIGNGCGGAALLDVSIIDDVDFPIVNIPNSGCIGLELSVADISDPLILDWEWTASNADITFDAGFVNFNWITTGPVEICLEIETECGLDQMCYDVDVFQPPAPMIDPMITVCELTFTLEATPSNGSSWLWTSPGSGSSVTFSNATNFITEVTVSLPGTYNFILQESGSFCDGFVETIVIIESLSVSAGGDDQICGLSYILSEGATPIAGNWEMISNPTDADAIFTNNNDEITVTVNQTGVYIFEYSYTSDNGCSGMDQKEINFLEDPLIENTQINCENGQFVVSFDIVEGISPYQVNGDVISGNEFISEPMNSGDIYSYQITDNQGCMSEVSTGTYLCDCDADAGSMDQLEVNICSIDGTSFSGIFNNDATLEIGDIGLFYLHTGSFNLLGTVLDINSSPDFIYESAYGTGVTLYISYVVGDDIGGTMDLTDDCLSVSIGQPVNIMEIQKIEVGNYSDLCTYSVDLGFDDLGYPGEWSLISSPSDGNANFADISIPNTSIEVDASGEYIITWSPIGGLCAIGDTTTLIFEPLLQFTSVVEQCNDELTTYNVTLTIEGGLAPYFIEGEEVLGQFVSEILPSGSNYSFTVTDSRGCSFNVDGAFECQCNNAPGTMISDTLVGCQDEILISFYNQDAILDEGDIGRYIIYEGTSTVVDLIIDIKDDPNINYSIDFILGQVYYIAYAIGDSSTRGEIDLQDPCLQISNGQPFVFIENDEVIAGDDTTICGVEYQLGGSTSTLEPFWTIIDSPTGSNVIYDASNMNTNVLVDQTGQYSFELSSGGLSCPSTDTVVLSFVPILNYLVESTICLADGYMVVVNITGGTMPYFIDETEITGSTYISQLIPLDDGYSFELTDSGFCDDVSIIGLSTCECDSDAGTLDEELISVCSLSDIPIDSLSNLDFVLDSDDVINWVIHTSDNSELGDILGVLDYSQNSISFNDYNFEYDVIYYVSIVVGDEGAIVDPTLDPCLSISVGASFIYEKPIELSSGDDQIFCGTETILMGTAPDTNTVWNINDLAPGGDITWSPDQFHAPLNVLSSGTYSFYLTPLDTECYITDTVYITSNENPVETEVDNLGIICNNASFGSVIDLNDQITGGYSEGIWIREGIEINPIIDFDGFEADEYLVTYSSSSENCGTLFYDVIITINDCQCPDVNIDIIDVTCFDFENGSISIDLEEGQDFIDYSISLNDVLYDALTISDLTAGSYSLVVSGVEDCNYEFDLSIDEPMPIAISLGGDMNVEIDDSITIVALTDIITSNIGSVLWEDLSGMLNEDGLELLTSFSANDSISIQIEDEAGCIAFDNIMIRVSRGDFIFPNVINPNSLLGNNVFSLKDTRGIEQIKTFTIYDRWGSIMYNVENVSPNSELAAWDGRYGSKDASVGVYVYNMIVLFEGEEIQLFGDLTVMR